MNWCWLGIHKWDEYNKIITFLLKGKEAKLKIRYRTCSNCELKQRYYKYEKKWRTLK